MSRFPQLDSKAGYMKNEDRIVELPAETLRRHDMQEEILKSHGVLLEKLVEGQLMLVKGQDMLVKARTCL